jgi:pimeloyl-ACP methyl ester carboxylesterase
LERESEVRRLLERELYPAGESEVTARFLDLASGLRVRVVEAGRGNERKLLFVPGWGCTAWIFHDNLAPLASAGFHAVVVELKGHGLSDKPCDPREYTVSAMSDHLLQIIDSLGFDRVGIVGHSMGAAIAAQAVVIAPERVTGLVLAAPVGFAGVKGMSLFRALTPNFAIPILPRLATRGLIRVMLRMVYGSICDASERDVEEFHAPVAFPDFTRAMRHLLHEFEWSAPFPELHVPWMTIVGSKDLLSLASDVGRYSSADGSARAVIVEGAGHVLFDESPEIVNAEVARFFGGARVPYILSQNEKNSETR